MRVLASRLVAAGAIALVCAAAASAQNHFAVAGQTTIPGVSGLRIVTVRDTDMSMCYTLFIVETQAPPAEATTATVPAVDTSAVVQRVRAAATRRDQAINALNQETQASSALDPTVAARYQAARRKIEDEYEQALRAEIPGSYPWASAVPGVRSGGWEDPANATRRALLDPDPSSTMKTLVEQFGRLESLLIQLIEAPRVAVSGPSRCSPDAIDRVQPVR
jgi:hypothetical protein